MHQPYYYSADKKEFQLPWVRLHALKDYLDMPLMASKYERIKTTFNLVPSLIDQLDMYSNGIEDELLSLSKLKTDELNSEQKLQILNSFFSCPQETMIEPYPTYFKSFEKYNQNQNSENLYNIFSSEEMRDIQVWSNLVWVDPLFRNTPTIKYLFEKGGNFSENDKIKLFDWQLKHISSIIPIYKRLFQQNKIDVSFSPYYHPILPLLVDSSSAKEALPNIKLPQYRFDYPEDAEKQITMAKDKFESLFDKPMSGMWPSEGSVSEGITEIIKRNGIKWIATDEEVLFNSIKKSTEEIDYNRKHRVQNYNGLNIFFRDHLLSDKIGFEYSRMDPEKAVDDLIGSIHKIRESNHNELEDLVVPVILDGENAWEYYQNDGHDFLDLLYSRLNDDEIIETITFSEASDRFKSEKLNSIFAGSWINSNFKIWIGHPEDNKAWDILYETRKILTEFEQNNPGYESIKITKAWEQIYIAEGSDWCWWYGDEHRGFQNDEFDMLFRSHIIQVYRLLELAIPSELNYPIHKTTSAQKILQPDNFINPSIDGKISHFFEWSGSGYLNQSVTSGAMHRADKFIRSLYFGFDENKFYIRLDFINRKNVKFKEDIKLILTTYATAEKKFDFYLDKQNYENDILFAFDDIIEIGIPREIIIDKQENIDFDVEIFIDNKKIEKCPEYGPIRLKIPKPGDEMFWPM
jgi:alpha-amylase/alpha-mannosidase (GH57 family)